MKTIEITFYKFEELSPEAQQKAIRINYSINVGFTDWWQDIYNDAERIGLKITGFDIERGNYCDGKIIGTYEETARLILREHGEKCATYQTALNYITEFDKIYNNSEDEEGDTDELNEQFLNDLLEDYLQMLKNEFEYLTSDEAIKETLIANDYDFTADGSIY